MINNQNNLEPQQLFQAIAQLQHQIQLKSDDAQAYKDLGNALQALGKLDEAKRAYSLAVAIQPNLAAAHANMGSIYYLQGELELAVECYARAIGIIGQGIGNGTQDVTPTSPPSPPALLLGGIYANLGNVRQQQGLLEEAVDCWQKAIALDPSLGVRWGWQLANALLRLGRYGAAIDGYEKLISQCQQLNQGDDLAKLYSNLGTARLHDGQVQEAIAAFQQALAIQPNLPELHCNLGLATGRLAMTSDSLLAIEQFAAAAAYFLRSLSIKPDLVEAHRGLFGLIQTFQPNNWDLSAVRQAADQYYQLCDQLGEQATYNQGNYQPIRAIALTAGVVAYLKSGNASMAQKFIGEIEQLFSAPTSHIGLQEFIDLIYSALLFSLNRLRDNLEKNSQISQLIGSQFSNYLAQKYAQLKFANNYPNINAKDFHLKIGFISAHFKRHSVAWCSFDIIRELSLITPNIYLYQTAAIQPDDLTNNYQELATKFYQNTNQLDYNIHTPNNQDLKLVKLIKEIEQDELDILIDLDSVTIPQHGDILYCQPASACISWLGFDAPFIAEKNYFLSDWHCHPAGVEPYYREQLLRMPDCFVAVKGFKSAPVERQSKRQEMGIDREHIVYLCTAQATKLNPELALAQIKILKQVSQGILLYKGIGDLQVIQSVYHAACVAENVSFERVKFLPRNRTEEEHRTIYQIADILLDSYPYNGGTHTLEALWFHLPVVTRFGQQFLARMGYAYLKTLGIAAGLASSWGEYVAWGTKLGLDASLRHSIREQLRKTQIPEYLSPLWNPQKFAQDMYRIFLQLLGRKIK